MSAENPTEELKSRIPKRLYDQLAARDGAAQVTASLLRTISPEKVATDSQSRRTWELCGLYFMGQNRNFEALRIFKALYHQLIRHQLKKTRVHKGMPLVWMSDCHARLQRPVIARRFLMLTLIEDAIESKGTIPPSTRTYFRIVWEFGMPQGLVNRYAKEALRLFKKDRRMGSFPEWILQQLDQDWLSGYPARDEVGQYPVNRLYIKFLLDRLGDRQGNNLELLAEYLLSVMPGCRPLRRARSPSTDYDIVCAMEGIDTDFRSELGRYFLAECKDWKAPADFTPFAKFCRVLDSVKSRFGILFSSKGISGHSSARGASREQLKIFQDRGIVIVVIDRKDIENLTKIGSGLTFTSLLRAKYENVRLDLVGSRAP